MNEIVLPHAVKTEPDSVFKARVVRQTHRRSEYSDTAIFKLNGMNYVIGREAQSKGRPDRITGPDKYRKGYLDVLLISALQKLLPNGHSNIIVGCAHTTDSVPYIDKIAEALGGKHEVTRYDGEQIKYVVRGMIPWDEPAGGLFRFMTRPYAEYNSEDIHVGHKILVVDIGGKISSMIPAIVLPGMKMQILWADGKSFPVGIQDVEATLRSELTDLYPDMFQIRSIPDSIIQEALQTGGQATIRNKPHDVTQGVYNATSLLLNELDKVYSNDLDKGLEFNHIVVTGGGGGLMFKTLYDELFGHDFVYLADTPRDIHLANLRGGAYSVSIWATENEKLVKPTKSGQKPAFVVIDPGNSLIKAAVMESSNA